MTRTFIRSHAFTGPDPVGQILDWCADKSSATPAVYEGPDGSVRGSVEVPDHLVEPDEMIGDGELIVLGDASDETVSAALVIMRAEYKRLGLANGAGRDELPDDGEKTCLT